MSSSLTELIASQDDLVAEAALALPHSFSHCTYSLGSLRQAVYLCLTCASPRGICSACSIACHTDHEQLELFPKRNFRCDCPTAALSHACTLHKTPEDVNERNSYGQNFGRFFCRCGEPYDPRTERETMIQCLACEDWFHESCLNLRERPSSREPSPAVEASPTKRASDEVNDVNEDDDAASEASSSGLPPPLIQGSEYESFVCGSCVSGIHTLKRYAGTPGVMMVVRDDPSSDWKVIGDISAPHGDNPVEVSDEAVVTNAGTKRPRSLSATADTNSPESKRARASPGPASSSAAPCLAPSLNVTTAKIFTSRAANDVSLGAGDIFLIEGWRDRWCHCGSCHPSLASRPFLLQEEETYEPPEDPDSGLSLEELGMRALQRLPRDRTIDGIHAFNNMRDELVQYLRPFAQEGKVVGETDVRAFFEAKLEAARLARRDR